MTSDLKVLLNISESSLLGSLSSPKFIYKSGSPEPAVDRLTNIVQSSQVDSKIKYWNWDCSTVAEMGDLSRSYMIST
jgi:hypothetical protein